MLLLTNILPFHLEHKFLINKENFKLNIHFYFLTLKLQGIADRILNLDLNLRVCWLTIFFPWLFVFENRFLF